MPNRITTWSGVLYSVRPTAFRHNFLYALQAITALMHLCTKFELCSCIRSTNMKGMPKFRNDDPVLCPCPWLLTFFEPKINTFRHNVEDYTTVPNFKSFWSGVFILLCIVLTYMEHHCWGKRVQQLKKKNVRPLNHSAFNTQLPKVSTRINQNVQRWLRITPRELGIELEWSLSEVYELILTDWGLNFC